MAWPGQYLAGPFFVPMNHRENYLSDLKTKMLVIEATKITRRAISVISYYFFFIFLFSIYLL